MPLLSGTPTLTKQRARFIVRVEAAPGRALVAKFANADGLGGEVAKSIGWFGGSMLPTKAPGRVTFRDLTLERGATQNADLWRWFAQAVAPTPTIGGVGLGHARVVEIIEQDRDRSTLNKWRVINAWPVDYSPGNWDNDSDDFLMERVVLTYDIIKPIGLPDAVSIDHLASQLP